MKGEDIFYLKSGIEIQQPLTRYSAKCYYCQRYGADRFLFHKHAGSFKAHICGKCLVIKDEELAQFISEKIPTYDDLKGYLQQIKRG